MKDFDWLQVHINNSFKNGSVKATIKVKRMYQIPLSNFLEFLFFYVLWHKINQTNSILKGLYQNLWRSLDTRRWKNSKTSHVFESLLLTAKMSLLLCQLASAKVLFIRSYRRCFPSYIAYFVVRLRISLLLLFIARYSLYIRVQQVETLRKLGIQAVLRTD
jgi:hypothetical protein